MSMDYYQILGLHPSADDELIDKAYRVLARRYHPDQQTGRDDTLRFKQIQEAYEVLNTPALRKQYDEGLLEHGQAMRVGVGSDVIQVLRLRFDQAARGGRVTINRISGQQIRQIDVNVPRAVEDGARLRLRGQGLAAQAGGPAGDLILIVAIEPHRRFRRDGLDLLVDIDIPVDVAMLGGRVPVPTLDGESEVEIPPGTSGGTKLRVRAAGLRSDNNQYGDLYAVVRIKIPKAVSRRAQEIAAVGADEDAPAAQHAGSASPLPMEHETADDLAARQARLDRLAGRLNMRMRRLGNYRTALRQRLRRLDYELRAGGQQRDLLDQHVMLVMLDADGERRTFPLSKPVTVIGRRAGCDLSIPLTSVSREHAQIEYRDGKLFVRDLGSSNGVQRNGERVKEAELAAGDVITISPVNLQVRIDGEPAEVDPPLSQIPEDSEAISYSAAAIAAYHEHQAYRREQQQVHQQAERIQRTRDDLAQQKRDLEQQLEQAQADRERLDGDGAALAERVEALERQQAELQRKQQALAEAEHAVEESRQTLQRERDELAARKHQLDASRAEFEATRERVLDDQTQQRGQTAELLQQQRDELESRKQAVDAERQKLAGQATQIESDRAQMLTEREALTARAAEFEAQTAAVQRDQRQLQQLGDDLAKRQQAIDAQAAELEARAAQLEQRERELAERGRSMDADLAVIAERDIAVAEREQRLDERLSKLPEHLHRIDEQREMIDSLQQQLAASQTEVEQYIAQLNARQQEVGAEEHRLNALREQVEQETCELEQQRQQVQRERDESQQQIQQLQRRHDEIERERTQTLAGLAEHQKRLEAREAELDVLADELDRRRSELEAAEQQLREIPVVELEPYEKPAAEKPVEKVAANEPIETGEGVSLGSVMASAEADEQEQKAATTPVIHFALHRTDHQPVFDLSPSHVRCAAGYRDRSGESHLLVDYIDAEQKTTNSWGAEIRYYRNRGGKTWDWVHTAIGRGSFDDGEADCFGAASPALVHVGSRVLMFYAGRGGVRLGDQPKILSSRGEAGWLSSRIMMAVAETDPSGAISGPFRKLGVVVDLGEGWDSLRLDHPAVVLDHQMLHLFYTGYDDARRLDHRQLGYATANVNDLKFTRRDQPALEVRGGGEMPRVFRHEGQWHLLYHHYARNDGARWRHYVSSHLPDFKLADPNFFEGVGSESNPLMVWADAVGRPVADRSAWVASASGGCWRMFPYQLDAPE